MVLQRPHAQTAAGAASAFTIAASTAHALSARFARVYSKPDGALSHLMMLEPLPSAHECQNAVKLGYLPCIVITISLGADQTEPVYACDRPAVA